MPRRLTQGLRERASVRNSLLALMLLVGGSWGCPADQLEPIRDSGRAPQTCGPENCGGCCQGDFCSMGVTAAACGSAGAACQVCPGGQYCGDGRCATCQNGCSAAGDLRCVSDSVERCVADEFGCLSWSESISCGVNESCADGACVAPLCGAGGQPCCEGTACNNGFLCESMLCKPIDSCLEYDGGCDVNATCAATGPDTNTCTCNAGYAGNGMTCVTDVGALGWALPCNAGFYTDGCDTSPQKVTDGEPFHGNPGKSYDLTVAFQGIVEFRTYTNPAGFTLTVPDLTTPEWAYYAPTAPGTDAGVPFPPPGAGGNPADTFNVYELATTSPPVTYVINSGTSGENYCHVLDFRETIRVDDGAQVTLVAYTSDPGQVINVAADGGFLPVIFEPNLPDGGPWWGQAVEMKVTNVTELENGCLDGGNWACGPNSYCHDVALGGPPTCACVGTGTPPNCP